MLVQSLGQLIVAGVNSAAFLGINIDLPQDWIRIRLVHTCDFAQTMLVSGATSLSRENIMAICRVFICSFA